MNLLTQSASLVARPAKLGSLFEHLHHRWIWFLALGGLVSFLGLAALLLVVSATIVSVFAIAVFMIIAGGAETVMGFHAHSWCRFFLWIFGGLAYVVIGAFAIAQPLMAAAVFTLVLGVAMIAMGCLRVYVGLHLRPHAHWPILLASGITAVVGLVILLGWPANSFIVLGLLLGLDLIFWGLSWIVLGLRMRAHGLSA